MIPFQIHLVWVNDDTPIASVQAAAEAWRATGLPLRVWTRSDLHREYGRQTGPENVQANYYRVKILGEHGGFYVDADSSPPPGAGDTLRRVLPAVSIVAATLSRGQYNNAPIGAAPGLPDWDSLANDPVNHFHRWNEYLRRHEHYVLVGWNAPELHRCGSLQKTGRIPSITTFPLKDGWLAQQADDWQFAALRKSGHHAILHWATNLTGRTTWHFNDCEVRPGKFRYGSKHVLREGDAPALRVCNFEDIASDIRHLSADRVIRHPWNCMASRIKGGVEPKPALWKMHAELFLSGGFFGIVFDRWHSDKSYRDSLAQKLGYFPVDDREGVPEIGRSMFDGRRYDGRASEMNVLHRWQAMRDHPDMQRIMADEELRELWQRVEATV